MTTGKVFAVHIQPADAAGRQITHGSCHASCHLLSTINRQAPLSAARNAKKDKSIRGIMTTGIQMTRNCFEWKRFSQRAGHFSVNGSPIGVTNRGLGIRRTSTGPTAHQPPIVPHSPERLWPWQTNGLSVPFLPGLWVVLPEHLFHRSYCFKPYKSG